jgi:hypothetical protein
VTDVAALQAVWPATTTAGFADVELEAVSVAVPETTTARALTAIAVDAAVSDAAP